MLNGSSEACTGLDKEAVTDVLVLEEPLKRIYDGLAELGVELSAVIVERQEEPLLCDAMVFERINNAHIRLVAFTDGCGFAQVRVCHVCGCPLY